MNEREPFTPSTALAAVGAGLVVGGSLLLADLSTGRLRDLAIYPVAAAVAVGAVLAMWHGGLGLLAFLLLAYDAVAARRAEPVTELGAESDQADTPSPLVGGGFMTEWESYHRDGLRRLFEHGRAAGKLTSVALIPAAFSDPKHWGYWTDLARHNGLCVKANGVTTVLPPNRNYVWALRRIYAWADCEAPDGDTPPLPLPHPFPAKVAYKVYVEKVGKGGLERDEDD